MRNELLLRASLRPASPAPLACASPNLPLPAIASATDGQMAAGKRAPWPRSTLEFHVGLRASLQAGCADTVCFVLFNTLNKEV